MFAARVDDAADKVRRDYKDISPSKSVSSGAQLKASSKETEESFDFERAAGIVHRCSEYLFDIFDANLTEEYRIMESFENSALSAFDGSSTGEFLLFLA